MGSRKRLTGGDAEYWGRADDAYGFFSAIRSSGANIGRILQHRNDADMCFISAWNPAGGSLSWDENKRNENALGLELRRLGFGFIRIEGVYKGFNETSFCVINYNEDSSDFVFYMSCLGEQFGQESILVALKGQPPFFRYFDGSSDEYLGEITLSESAIKDFFSMVHGHKFVFQSFVVSSVVPILYNHMGLWSRDVRRKRLLNKGSV